MHGESALDEVGGVCRSIVAIVIFSGDGEVLEVGPHLASCFEQFFTHIVDEVGVDAEETIARHLEDGGGDGVAGLASAFDDELGPLAVIVFIVDVPPELALLVVAVPGASPEQVFFAVGDVVEWFPLATVDLCIPDFASVVAGAV